MRKQLASIGTLGFAALALLGACSGGGDSTGAAGTTTTSTGAAGTTATGAAGTGTAGTTAPTGTAGTTAPTGTAGTNATGTAGTTATGTAGTGAAGTTAGTAGTGTAGTGAAGTGAAGTGAVVKRSAGCTMAPPATDSATTFIKHDIAVTGVDQAYITAHPLPTPGQGQPPLVYSFTNRNYYVRLPTNYDPGTAYGVAFGGTGCAGSETVGSEGGNLPKGSQMAFIQVSLSYVPTAGATSATNPGSCFADSAANSPDVPYFDATLKEVEAKYCVDTSKVVVSGYSSGAWEAFMLGWARAGVVRGIATEAGGLRMSRPPGTNKPVAAFIVTTKGDTENPADLKATDAKAISLGALGVNQARDEILARNGCTGTATTLWDPADTRFPLCQKYTGCPAAYPVVYCVPDTGAHYPSHAPYTPDGMYKFLSGLPAVP